MKPERERVILANQNVGVRVTNKYLCCIMAVALRAPVRAELWYGYNVNYLVDRAFEAVAEGEVDEPLSPSGLGPQFRDRKMS